MAERIRVVFVDDEPRLRASWESLIKSQEDMEFIASLPTADELEAAVPANASILLIDLTMPGRDVFEAVAEIGETCPECRAILYSGYSDHDIARQALAAGAWGLVDKLTPPSDILNAIRRVAGGDVVFPRGFTA